jgi:hypothetical protein
MGCMEKDVDSHTLLCIPLKASFNVGIPDENISSQRWCTHSRPPIQSLCLRSDPLSPKQHLECQDCTSETASVYGDTIQERCTKYIGPGCHTFLLFCNKLSCFFLRVDCAVHAGHPPSCSASTRNSWRLGSDSCVFWCLSSGVMGCCYAEMGE